MMNCKHPKKNTYRQKKGKKSLMNSGQFNNTITECQKITNLPDNASNQQSKFRTKS